MKCYRCPISLCDKHFYRREYLSLYLDFTHKYSDDEAKWRTKEVTPLTGLGIELEAPRKKVTRMETDSTDTSTARKSGFGIKQCKTEGSVSGDNAFVFSLSTILNDYIIVNESKVK